MASSEVEICNLALSWLAGNLITSLDDETVEAKLCKANYPLSRDAVLEAGAWTFATKRYALTPEVDEPAWGYGKRFTIPPEIITVLEVTESPTKPNGANTLDWRREGNYIVANVDKVYVKAVFRETQVPRYPPAFVQALAARIAADIAIPLTESREMMQVMEARYKDRLYQALGTDGIQGKVDIADATKLTGFR